MRNAEECRLINIIDQATFALDDLRLFLDTHPTDQGAIAYYQKYSSMREKAVREYTTKFGPINADFTENLSKWQWNTCPYPWEVE